MGIPEVVVHDQLEPCPYLEGELARLPLRVPLRALLPSEADQLWSEGDRRAGPALYRVACPGCRECQPLRLEVASFRPSRSQRRVWNRGLAELDVELTSPRCDDEHLELYRRHKHLRGLGDEALSVDGYRSFLVERCIAAFEIRYLLHGRLVGVAITDRGEQALSAVYTFFDPSATKLSVGTFSVLQQIELARHWRMDHLYLGYYVRSNPHMSYKARFRPYQVLVAGAWREAAGDDRTLLTG